MKASPLSAHSGRMAFSAADADSGFDSDAALLARFVKTADGAAFSALVERHLGLVFGTACRRMESRELAQEAAQNTFCRLAKHAARISIRESLAPWLHKVALREAGTLMRAERSRQRALHRLAASLPQGNPPVPAPVSAFNSGLGFGSGPDSVLHPEAESDSTSACSGSAWSSNPPSRPARGHLDEALARLPEPARRVIILRYLQGLSLRELATAESSSEEAVRKRVSRALDRLTTLLARRGVTASAMMGCLTHVPLWPVPPPAGIAARAAKEAAAASATAGLATFAVTCWPAAAVFLAVAIPAAVPWGSAGPAPSGVMATADAPGGSPASPQRRTKPLKPAMPELLTGLKRELSAMQSKGIFDRDVPFGFLNMIARQGFRGASIDAGKWAAMQKAVSGFSLDQIQAAASLVEGPGGDFIAETFYARWAELAPEEARKTALALAEKSGNKLPLQGVLRVLVRRDPAGTLKWAAAHAPLESREALIHSLAGPLAFTDPRAYVRLMEDPGMKYEKPVPDIQPIATDSGVGDALCAVLPFDTAFALEGLRQKERDGSLKGPVFALEALAYRGPLQPPQAETMAVFAENLPADSGLRQGMLNAAAIALADSNPPRAADLMAASRPGSGDDGWLGKMTALLRGWQHTDATAPGEWLAARAGLDLDPEVLATLIRGAKLRMPETTSPSPVVTP